MGRRTHRQVLADDEARRSIIDKRSKVVKSDDASTRSAGFFADDTDDAADDPQYLAEAFVGRLTRTYVYDDIIRPYAESRGRVYALINRSIESNYVRFVCDGGYSTEKFFVILLFLIKTNAEISQWGFSKTGAIYDSGRIPMGTLKDVSSRDYDYIVDDIMNKE